MPSNKTLSKSDFIRNQPATLSAAEVVAKAKAEGIKIDVNHVYKVRGRSKTKASAARKAPSSATGTAAPANTRIKSKADFVRAHPGLSPKEVVEKAKAEGIKIGWRYVYNVRGSDKAAGKKKRAATTASSSKPASTNGTERSVATSSAASSAAEDLLRALGAELGLGRAIEILTGERARVQSFLRR